MYIVNDISKLFSSFHIPQNVHCITCWTKMAKRFLIFHFLWIIGYSSMKKITQLGWPFFYSVGNCEEWLCYCHFFSLPCLTDRIYSCEEKKLSVRSLLTIILITKERRRILCRLNSFFMSQNFTFFFLVVCKSQMRHNSTKLDKKMGVFFYIGHRQISF